MNKFLPLWAWQDPLDPRHPLFFSAGWTTRTQLVNKQTTTGWHFIEKHTSKCEVAKTLWVCTCIFIRQTSPHACGRLHTLTHESSGWASAGKVWLPNCCSSELCPSTGLCQQDTGSAHSENKVYVTLVPKANILISLSSQETERLNLLRIVRSMDIRRKFTKMNFNEICWKCFVFISKCWLNVNTNKWLINLSFTLPQSWI